VAHAVVTLADLACAVLACTVLAYAVLAYAVLAYAVLAHDVTSSPRTLAKTSLKYRRCDINGYKSPSILRCLSLSIAITS
jgi:hypothetical protein